MEKNKFKTSRKEPGNKLISHLEKNKEALVAYSEMAGIAKHKTIIGSAREAIISGFLSQNIPKFIEYYTGEIFDSENKESGQIDIILHPITSPKFNLYNSISLFPSETVLTAIEVKSLLDKARLYESLSNCQKTKKLRVIRNHLSGEISSPIVDPTTVPYVVFAFRSSKNFDKILLDIADWLKSNNQKATFQDLPDMIVVLRGGKKKQDGFALVKHKSWYAAGLELKQLYEEIYGNPLFPLLTYLTTLIENWASNPNAYAWPSTRYLPQIDNNDYF